MRTTGWLFLTLLATAELACTRPTPGYCVPGGPGPDVCLAEGMVCNPRTYLCERHDGGTSNDPAPPQDVRMDVPGDAQQDARDATGDGSDGNDVGTVSMRCETSAQCPTSMTCVDGMCCASPGCGTCQSCAVVGHEGRCTNVPPGTEDEDTRCNGEWICAAAGACKKKNGEDCAAPADCFSNFCTDGVCCEEACSGTCYACNTSFGAGLCRSLNLVEDPAATPPCTGANICRASGSSPPTCKLKDGQPCTRAEDCSSNVCLTVYPDADRDGFGAGSPLQFCGANPPAGHAVAAGDCCEMDALAHPGQANYYNVPHRCGTFDYNCDTREDTNSTLGSACGCSAGGGGNVVCFYCH